MDLTRVILPSGRAVSFAPLRPSQSDKVLLAAAKTIEITDNVLTLQRNAEKLGVPWMVREISTEKLTVKAETMELVAPAPQETFQARLDAAKADLKARQEAAIREALAGAKWRPLDTDDGMLEDERIDSLFTTKDWKVLLAIYRDHHDIGRDEVDAIMGKALTVAAEK